MDEVVSSIKSCLRSTKGGVLSLYELNRDYHLLECEKIPHRKLGFPTLEAFIEQVPGLRRFNRDGSIYIGVVSDEKTAHLDEMIRKQRAPRKKRRPVRMHTLFRRPIINSSTKNNVNPTSRVYNSPIKFPTYPKPPYKPPSREPAMHLGEPKVYAPKPLASVQPQQTCLEVQQRLQQAQNNHQTPRNPSPLPGNPGTSHHLQVRINSKITTKNGAPSNSAQSAPVQSFNMNPFRDNSNGSSDCAGRQVNRQNSLPQVRSSGTRANLERNPGNIPTLKVARPISERLKRTVSESEQKVAFTHDYPNPLSPLPEDNDDPRKELNLLIQRLNLDSPKYKIVRNVNKKRKIDIYCLLEVGSEEFKTYPVAAADEITAAKLAATSAIMALNKVSEPLTKMTTDKQTILHRLISIVEMHTAGVFMEKLSGYYTDKHHEILPPDWMDVVGECSDLSLSKGVNNTIIVMKNLEPAIAIRKVEIQTPPVTPSRATNPFSTSSNITIPPLVLPSDHLFPVYVSHVSTISDIFVRSLDDENNKNFYEMSQKIYHHYSTVTEPSPSVTLHHNYVMKVDDECLRVRVENVDSVTGDADVFFIDTGEMETVECSQLYPLKPQFSTIPAQAIRVSLFTTEELAICDTTTDIAEKFLLDRTFFLEALNREMDDISHVVVGIFYDTSGEDDVQVNDLIIQDVYEQMESSRLDVRLATGGVIEVLLSHIEYNGDVYLQSKNDGLVILSTMLNALLESVVDDQERMKNARPPSSGPLDPKEIYVAQRSDDSWVRVRVAFPGVTNPKMRMVDYGQLLDVNRRKLFKLKTLSEAIAGFPIQAALVELHNVKKTSFTERMATRLRQLAPRDEPLLCKVTLAREHHQNAFVELFKRSQPDNSLISINNTLELEPELVKNEDGNNNVKTRKSLSRTYSRGMSGDDSVRNLKQPRIPGVSEIFEVHVTNSTANPGNFMVQPFADKLKLESLMERMQNTYGNMSASSRVDSPIEGKFYAAKNHDGNWCRACINKVVDEHLVAVYLCDFGNLAVIGIGQLQVLKKEFCELPQQAIKARLVGIKPRNTDWSIQDCMRFQQLVENKDFVAKVMTQEPDNLVATGIVLGLDLIDVSEDQDVHIHDILIQEKRAVPEKQ